MLIKYITEKLCRKLGINKVIEIDDFLMQKLVNYSWPGNVREMENVLEREIINNHKTGLRFDNIVFKNGGANDGAERKSVADLDNIMREHILKTLNQTNWRISGKKGAAYILGLHPNTLRHRMKKLGIF
jgi:transcriptional regulator of acetoin/glycerol metabolism